MSLNCSVRFLKHQVQASLVHVYVWPKRGQLELLSQCFNLVWKLSVCHTVPLEALLRHRQFILSAQMTKPIIPHFFLRPTICSSYLSLYLETPVIMILYIYTIIRVSDWFMFVHNCLFSLPLIKQIKFCSNQRSVGILLAKLWLNFLTE